jgi:hypothetical protein
MLAVTISCPQFLTKADLTPCASHAQRNAALAAPKRAVGRRPDVNVRPLPAAGRCSASEGCGRLVAGKGALAILIPTPMLMPSSRSLIGLARNEPGFGHVTDSKVPSPCKVPTFW